MPFNHCDWVGPNHPFALCLKHREGGKFPDTDNPDFARRLEDTSMRIGDSLASRFNAITSLACFARDPQRPHFDAAVGFIDEALRQLGEAPTAYPAPGADARTLKQFGLLDLQNRVWTAGTFGAYDFLHRRWEASQPPRRETTPVLAVRGDVIILNDINAVLNLVVEALPGPRGLVTPDFWALGLMGFPGTPDSNFVSVMHSAFRAVLSDKHHVRLRWRLEKRRGDFPRVIQGRSATASAACCALGLAEQMQGAAGPLLDRDVAITACLEPTNQQGDHALGAVNEETINAKFQAALEAKLAGVVVSHQQRNLPPNGVYQNRQTLDGKPMGGEMLVHSVGTLEDAFDALLAVPTGIKAYKNAICRAWDAVWEERETPEEFKADSKTIIREEP
jgi:hypothetical protein